MHSYFIFVDNGSSGSDAWGTEIELREALEYHVAKRNHISKVLMAVQGGVGTLSAIHTAGFNGMPVVLLADSGGASTAMREYCTSGMEGVTDARFHEHETLMRNIVGVHEAYGRRQLKFMAMTGEDGNTLDVKGMLLESIIDMIGEGP
eukprot:288145-Prymnesium_polylepis.1